jgi:hypothetical protein
MKNNFYKIGFYTLLSILILGILFIKFNSQSGSTYSPNNNGNTKIDSVLLRPEEVAIQNLIDSVQIVKDSINNVENFMIDSIDLRKISLDQRNAYYETIYLLHSTKLHLDFKLDAVRLQQIKAEAANLQSVIAKYDNKKDKIDLLSNKLKNLTSTINSTLAVISSAVSRGLIVPQKSDT